MSVFFNEGSKDNCNDTIICSESKENVLISMSELEDYKAKMEKLIDDINRINEKVENKIDKDVFKKYEEENIIYCYVPKKEEGETSHTPAIKRAISKLTELGGGEIRWIGTLEIEEPIDLTGLNISIKGVGEVSIIKAIKSMDYCLRLDYNSQYGARGVEISNLYIDCNNLANEGLQVGHNNPVVQSLFTSITISNSLKYGLVVDTSQNCQFTLINMENCAGGIQLLNGAGNNVFLKCEINGNKNGLPQIIFDKDPTRLGYNNNGFAGKPQKNVFIGCITERIESGNNILINYGMSNEFISHEIECTNMTESSIVMRENANYNYISCRMACGNSSIVPVFNEGYRNIIQNSYIENSSAQYFAIVTRTLIMNGVYSNREIKVKSNAGDEGYNIIMDSNASYGDFSDLSIGKFGFDSNNILKFKTKNKLLTIKTEE